MGQQLTAKYSVQLGFSFNTRLGNNLTRYRNAVINQDYDCCVLIDGGEGLGKSVFGMQVAYFLDIEHSIDINTQVCYTPEQFKQAVMTLKRGKAIIWDEARRGVNRRRFSQDVNLEVTDLLAECRQHNLFLVVIMPSFYDMDMNVAVWRSRCLIHVYGQFNDEDPEKPLKRGFFRFYNEEGKKELYTNKMTRQQYRYPLITNKSFDASFPHHYVVEEKDYRERKRKSEEYYRNRQKRQDKLPLALNALREGGFLLDGAFKHLAEVLGVSERTVYRWCQADEPGITN